jgi:hypothetical protein
MIDPTWAAIVSVNGEEPDPLAAEGWELLPSVAPCAAARSACAKGLMVAESLELMLDEDLPAQLLPDALMPLLDASSACQI